MTRLTLHLTPLQTETLDWIMSGDESYRPDNRHRRRERERIVTARSSLNNALATAALLDTRPRDDFGGLERRLERALRKAGFEMPAMPHRRLAPAQELASRNRGGAG